jgi:hypothetical protein
VNSSNKHCCEYGNGVSGSVKGWVFSDWLTSASQEGYRFIQLMSAAIYFNKSRTLI